MHDNKQRKINNLFQSSNCALYLTDSSCLSRTEETKWTEGGKEKKKKRAEHRVLVQMILLSYQAMYEVHSIVPL